MDKRERKKEYEKHKIIHGKHGCKTYDRFCNRVYRLGLERAVNEPTPKRKWLAEREEHKELHGPENSCKTLESFRIRMYRMGLEKAINTPINKRKWEDAYKKHCDLHGEYAIQYLSFTSKIKKKWLQRAIYEEPRDVWSIKVLYDEHKRQCWKDSVSYWCFVNRIYRGRDPVKAVTEPTLGHWWDRSSDEFKDKQEELRW